jgi:hypothetical protein
MNCKVEDCETNKTNIPLQRNPCGYCSRHYQQIKKFGCIKNTIYDKNKIYTDNENCYISLYDRLGNEKEEVAICDKDDFDLVKNYRWSLFPGNYVWNNKNKCFLHNILMSSKQIDHVDGNGLNNKRSNLRYANQSQNNMNKRISKNNSSGFKGVHFDNYSKKWIVQIRKNKKLVFKKGVKSKEEAAILYDQKAKELFGEFARTNEMEKMYEFTI